MRKSMTWLAAGVLMLVSCTVSAQVPSMINYQGRLMDGTNLVNAEVGLVLRLFNAETGGLPQFTDSNDVSVVDGIYSTVIGQNPVHGDLGEALTNDEVWIEAEVMGTPAILYRNNTDDTIEYIRSGNPPVNSWVEWIAVEP